MERHRLNRAWSRYLDAEREGRLDEAETELAELFHGLSRPAPRAGFADRVMARVHSPFASPAFRLALAATLVAAALAAALLAPMVPALIALLGPGDLVAALAEGLTALAGRFATGAALWRDIGNTTAALGRAASHPQVLILVSIQFALAALALRVLASLAGKKGSTDHAVS
jgi:hypothetical protein